MIACYLLMKDLDKQYKRVILLNLMISSGVEMAVVLYSDMLISSYYQYVREVLSMKSFASASNKSKAKLEL